MVLIAIGGMAFAVLQPIQVLPRIRLAPGYAFADATGSTVTSEDGRGSITVYTFVPLDCGSECDAVDETMRLVRDRVPREVDLGDAGFRMVTIALDPDASPASLAAAAERSAGRGEAWTWLSGSASQIENVVGLGFRRGTDPDDFAPSYAIVDGWGMVRGEYRYQTLADDADKLVRHIGILGSELRNDHGIGSFAYDAAHVFQCYP